ncbi:MAG TPA: hypothetical protein VMQ39_01625 [Candidatus Dormibacteraeota bacterium]|nr:hypothetical protein [Candidatus Dormibacteraeota bacterium]
MNRLYFGDNLKWLSDRKEFADASVDLVYLDPPFNSNADYNVLFREPSGQANQAQFHAFTDTWSWADAADAGLHTSTLWHDRDYPRIQILTVEGLLNGTERVDAPPQLNPFAMAARESKQHAQTEML